MLSAGVDPATGSVDDALKAIDVIKKARDAGQFRKITGNSYTEDLGIGDTWAAMAWSGDVAALQKDHPDLQWVLPAEGANSFVDTLMIPIGANLDAAAAWINYLYDPTVSGPLFEAINYVSPVTDAGKYMSADAAKNPLINPPASAKISVFKDLSEADAATLETAYSEATQL
jgi:spermidine/putrescine transport system substrate-binding protein